MYIKYPKTEKEKVDTQARCATQNIDFEFVLDSSGSIGTHNWDTTVDMISRAWMDAIQPVFRRFGNHVAARWFSTNTDLFLGFQDFRYYSKEYSHFNYSEFVSLVIKEQSYYGGGTDTAQALTEVYESDLPTSRLLGTNQTIVLLFTDGKSNDYDETVSAADTLKNVSTIFTIGIGYKLNITELNAARF